MAKFRFYLGTGYVGADHEEIYEIEDDVLEGKSDSEIESIVDEHFDDWYHNKLDTFWERIDEDEEDD